jgi:hypothetical protein
MDPGVEIQANFIDMVLTDSYLKELNLWLYLLVEIILQIGYGFFLNS